jgi:hypothetical protein
MLIATDALSLVFIACFLFGLLFLLGTALLGNLGHGHAGIHSVSHHMGVHVAGHAHAPHIGGPHAVGHSTHVATHGPAHSTHSTGHTGPTGGTQNTASHSTQENATLLSYLNPTSIVLFLLGFGFFGYVFHNTAHLILPFTLLFSGMSGVLIAILLLVMLSRIFGESEANTVQDVVDRTGLLGKVSITIPENSLGEIIYISPGGLRKSIAARSTDGRRLERGQEVVVINYQRGVAEVDTWEHFINEEDTPQTQGEASASNEDDLAKLRALLEEADPLNTELVMRKDLQKE